MSALVHCDGPDCDQTRDADELTRRLCTPSWIHVEEGPAVQGRDFHSRECMAKWAGEDHLLKTSERIWWEGYNAAERDATKAPPAAVTPCPYKTRAGRP